MGEGGISEAFAKRLFEFLQYDEGKFSVIFFSRCNFPLAMKCAELEFEVMACSAVAENNVSFPYNVSFRSSALCGFGPKHGSC